MCGRPDNRVAFSGCFLNNQTGDYCTEAAHLQHMRPPGAQYRNSPFPPSPNACNWCNCSFRFKCLARAYILEADCALIKEAQGWDSHKKKIRVKCCLVCWFRHLVLLCVDAAKRLPSANSAGAHQRWWKYRESLYAAPLKHRHGERALVFPCPHKEL